MAINCPININIWSHKVTWTNISLSWEWPCIQIFVTMKRIMSNGIFFSPWPNMPIIKSIIIHNVICHRRSDNMILLDLFGFFHLKICKWVLGGWSKFDICPKILTYTSKNSWSGPHKWFAIYMILSSSPFSHDFVHFVLILSLNNFVPHADPTIGTTCLGWSRITWIDAFEFSHSWTAAYSLSLDILSRSLDTYRLT